MGYFSGIFDFLELKTYDFRVRLFASSKTTSDDIYVVLLDQPSIDWAAQERGWSWPWPRQAYAEMINYMNIAGASAVAFDVIFSEPSVYGSEDDAAFINADRDFGRTAHTVFFSSRWGSTKSWPPELNTKTFNLTNFDSVISGYNLLNSVENAEKKTIGAQFPIPGLLTTAGSIGNVTSLIESDGIVRRARLFTLFDGKAVPGLSAASLLVAGSDTDISYDQKDRSIRWGEYTIPAGKNGGSLLRFKGGDLDKYWPYSASKILQSAEAYARGEEPVLPPEEFTGKFVFFGLYAAGLFDICTTPISSTYPGMGVHITMLDNILKNDFIRESPSSLAPLMSFLAIAIMVILVLYSSHITITVAGSVALIAIITGIGFLAYYLGYWITIVFPLSGAIFAFLAASIYKYATEGSQKRFIKSAFSRYLSPSVIEQIIVDPSKLNLGGEKREMTAIFTDIQRFSSISEALQNEYADEGPKVLVDLLNLYLTEMSNIVLDNGGTIDKFEGDAIIAFFGAPIWTDQHAILACRSAIRMKKRELELREDIMKSEGAFYTALSKLIADKVIRPERPLYTRIGINTGDMVVGNMGTPNKMDYTIMGNAVNLAARLEGVNKQYDTSGILISEYTRAKIGDAFALRGLSRVRVVGVNTPLRLYEILDLREDAAPAMLDMLGFWEKAFDAYERQDFTGALDLFKSIYRENDQDRVAKLYLDRCEKYASTPPSPEKWDNGVDNLTEK
ncbi:adenylate/guanylate cyclase catalytic domain protein [Treponema primitia ZAS-2]|uniref:Adenylate/guanylate cyclase catalytic domain protein n=1 Tax=Treponema primitia (strain ATCC BAA-887 / DSM 12427 / ZAS-2) TaxID=545694 RepID=F5YN78_TREPZ|nr:adenylate/guanylate cyclase catalytic domain protein [Treponema primitia ZAS-2]